MDKWIKWSQWSDTGMMDKGEMPLSNLQKVLKKFEKEAQAVLKETNADHVIYGVKYYDKKTGQLEEVRFYMLPMDENRFQSVGKYENVIIYALHKR
jgi:hypothetical protein